MLLPRYESLKLNHDTKFLMTSEEAVEDPLMSVQFINYRTRVISFRVTVHLLFSFLLQETLKSVFLLPYGYLKLKKTTQTI